MPSIVRGEIRTDRGNLCLYPRKQNLENFEVDIRYEFVSLICIQLVFLLMHIGWENVSILLQRFFQSLLSENRCISSFLAFLCAILYFCRIGEAIGGRLAPKQRKPRLKNNKTENYGINRLRKLEA